MSESVPLPGGSLAGADPRLAGCRLTVDLGALAENYRLLVRAAAPAKVASVIKADAYGIGIANAVPVLWKAGCRTFFVAFAAEGIAARRAAPEADIYVLNGLFGQEAAPVFADFRLMPVLNSQADIATWEAYGWDGDVPRPSAVLIDTGMNRLGLTPTEALAFAEDNALTNAITPRLVMSHLVHAEEPLDPLSRDQLESFQSVSSAFPDAESSIANSAGIFLGADFRLDQVRAGIALYGGQPSPAAANVMRSVVTAEARIVQVRQAKAGETVSYGAMAVLERDTTIAVVAAGYADGYHRAGSGSGVPLRRVLPQSGHGFIASRRVPILGRITMDLTMFDVTELGPDQVRPGDWIELFGPNIPIDEVAAAAGTISYELLTSLGKRYYRRYVGANA